MGTLGVVPPLGALPVGAGGVTTGEEPPMSVTTSVALTAPLMPFF
jgi:hypothetical protein